MAARARALPDVLALVAAATVAWRATVGGVAVELVEDRTGDAHAADRDASLTIRLRGAAGWFEHTLSWTMQDVEMSTVHRTSVTHRRVRTGALADGRPVLVVQIDLREEEADRRPRGPWLAHRAALIVACVVDRDAPACTPTFRLDCAARCERARLRDGALVWRDRAGDHREPLAIAAP